MPFLIHALIAVLMALFCAPDAGASDDPAQRIEHFVGYAHSLDSDELVYSEHHRRIWRGQSPVSMETRYRLPNGETFARRSVEYVDGGRVTFTLEDDRSGYLEGARMEGEALELFVRRGPDRSRQSDTIGISQQLIVDAGFDTFVRDNFDALKAGETIRARFAVPSRRSAYDCEITRLREGSIDGEPTITLRMAFKGFLLSWFADPVDVTYHRQTGELVRYEGVSNLRTPDGDNYQVRIELPLAERSVQAPKENS